MCGVCRGGGGGGGGGGGILVIVMKVSARSFHFSKSLFYIFYYEYNGTRCKLSIRVTKAMLGTYFATQYFRILQIINPGKTKIVMQNKRFLRVQSQDLVFTIYKCHCH